MLGNPQKYSLFGFAAFPLIPLTLGILVPKSKSITSLIKPFFSFQSHIQQLLLSWKNKSTKGLSKLGLLLQMTCGLLGLISVSLSYRVGSKATFIIFGLSFAQPLSLLVLNLYFDKMKKKRSKQQKKEKKKRQKQKKKKDQQQRSTKSTKKIN
ncbi:MAG: hypothetical protein EZS28_030336 [Streblomastix strix]|uniref:Uncharacterized protein n=1 Tax=Streblomastix strix TaxID=222440 RepID=A0A5J4UUQ6_9EUKA|nr:MAG: hypothetical protein EZS28_030336 [Streblomastix strix]